MKMQFKTEATVLAITSLPFLYLAYIWSELPAKVPIHWNIEGQIDGWGDKSSLVTLVLLLCGLTYAIFLIVPLIDPKDRIKNMGRKYQNLRLILTVFFTALSLFILYSSKSQSIGLSKMMIPGIGVLFIILGNYFQTIRPNYFIGIKTPWTLENDQVWKDTHKLGGILWVIGGILMVIIGLLELASVKYLFLSIVLAISIIPIGYSYIRFRSIQKEN